MKRALKGILPVIVFMGMLLVSNDILAAPPGSGGGPGGQGGCVPPPCVPIDGGLSILLAAGAAFGGKKLHDQYK